MWLLQADWWRVIAFHLPLKSENPARVNHKGSMGKGLRWWSKISGEWMKKSASQLSSPAWAWECWGDYCRNAHCSANYWARFSAVVVEGQGAGRGGGDKGLLATKPVPSLATNPFSTTLYTRTPATRPTLSSPFSTALDCTVGFYSGDNGGFGGQMLQDEKGYICQVQHQFLALARCLKLCVACILNRNCKWFQISRIMWQK